MARTILSVLFMTAIVLTMGVVASIDLFEEADAFMKSKGTYTRQYGSATAGKVCGDRLCSEVSPSEVKERVTPEAVQKLEEIEKTDEFMGQLAGDALMILQKLQAGETLSESEVRQLKNAFESFGGASSTTASTTTAPSGIVSTGPSHEFGKTASETITSAQDPGIGHEGHQLAVLLPPSENVYVGRMSFSASEPVQYVALHGPLGDGDDMGQPIWSPDGETKYALTLVDNGLASGGWFFAGNALALHTMNSDPFSATYSIAYSEVAPGEYPKGTVESGTVHSMQDPGIGHESHSLAIVLPPRDVPYQGGVIAYSASEPVQLVALHGPLAEGEDKGQAIWTPDGETKYALTLVSDDDNMGVWSTFSGNALAFHTMNSDGFSVSYTIAGLH